MIAFKNLMDKRPQVLGLGSVKCGALVLTADRRIFGVKPVLQPLCQTQIPHG